MTQNKRQLEADATREVIDALDTDGAMGDMPVSAVAGALMRASVTLAMESYGKHAPDECRKALERVLADMGTNSNRRLN